MTKKRIMPKLMCLSNWKQPCGTMGVTSVLSNLKELKAKSIQEKITYAAPHLDCRHCARHAVHANDQVGSAFSVSLGRGGRARVLISGVPLSVLAAGARCAAV